MTPPPGATPPVSRWRVAGGLAATGGGLVLFWYALRQAGVGDVAAGIRNLGWAFGLVLLLSGLRFTVRSLAWIRCMPAGHGLRLRDVLPAFIGGDAVGNLGPVRGRGGRTGEVGLSGGSRADQPYLPARWRSRRCSIRSRSSCCSSRAPPPSW